MECERYRDHMLDVLYGEADTETARLVEEHQSACEACRGEMMAFRHVRRDLKAWTLPALAPHRSAPSTFRAPRVLAMAAGLVMAAGAALGLSGSELSYQNGQITFRLGRGPAASPDVAALLAAQEERHAAQEERHQREIQALKEALGAAPTVATASLRPARDAGDASFQRMIQESEARQAGLLNASLTDFEERLADQRSRDLKTFRTFMAYVDGRANLKMAENASLVAQVLPASQPR
jgi:hypothetical protein